MALSLLLVQLGLQLGSHLVVPVLGLLEVEPNLVDIGQGVEVLMLVHGNIRLLVLLLIVGVHSDNLSLKFFILFLEGLLLPHFLLNGYD